MEVMFEPYPDALGPFCFWCCCFREQSLNCTKILDINLSKIMNKAGWDAIC